MTSLRALAAAALFCLLSACASVGDLQRKTPSIEYDSAKGPTVLAGCITQGWSQHKEPIETQLRENGVVVSVRNEAAGGGVVSSAFITETDNGSHLRFAELDISVGMGWMSAAVDACR